MPPVTTHMPLLADPVGTATRATFNARGPRSESGQALVEFALVLPMVIVILFGIVLFGVALNDSIDQTHLVSEAARFASVGQNCIVNGSPHACASKEEEGLLKWTKEQADDQKVKETTTASICSPTSLVGDYVEVKLNYKYDWLKASRIFELFGQPHSAETPITSTAQMRIEVPPSKPYPTTC
jgi:TadE-like protein